MCQQCKQNGLHPEFESLLHNDREEEIIPEVAFDDEYESSLSSWFSGWPSTVSSYLSKGKEMLRVKSAIAQGERNENALTNIIFYDRHPELNRKPLTKSQPNFSSLSKEWLNIRDQLIRPALVSPPVDPSYPAPSGSTTPSLPANPNMAPIEAPLKGITGYTCKSGKKCWDKAKSADIVDADAPWNKPGNRSAPNYLKVLDYFNVGEAEPGNHFNKPSENPRYRQERNAKGGISTYCNIYVHDVTRAMWASIPHWVKTRSGPNELNANDTVVWLLNSGKDNGWLQIDKGMVNWINNQNAAGNALAAPNPSYSAGLSNAGSRVASTPGIDKKLIMQPAYIAQLYANLGLPTVAVWNNPGGIGHVAMIRPEEPGKNGKVESGMFRPRSAQAGAMNFSNNYLVFGAGALKSGVVLFFVHE